MDPELKIELFTISMRSEQYFQGKFGRSGVKGAAEAPFRVQGLCPGGGFKPKENRLVQGRLRAGRGGGEGMPHFSILHLLYIICTNWTQTILYLCPPF